MSSKKNAFSKAYDLLKNDSEPRSNALNSSKRLPKIGSMDMDLSFPDSYNLTGDSIDAFMKIQGRAFRAGPKPITKPLQLVKEKHDGVLLSKEDLIKEFEKNSQNTVPAVSDLKSKNAVKTENNISPDENKEASEPRVQNSDKEKAPVIDESSEPKKKSTKATDKKEKAHLDFPSLHDLPQLPLRWREYEDKPKLCKVFKYTAILRIQSGHYNLYPLFRWNDGVPKVITDPKGEFPDFGNILLDRVDALDGGKRFSLKNGLLFNLEFEQSDLLEGESYSSGKQSITHWKIDAPAFYKEKRIVATHKDELYWQGFYIVYAEDPKDVDFGSNIFVTIGGKDKSTLSVEVSDIPGTQVLLKLGKYLYGPFTLYKDNLSRAYIRPYADKNTKHDVVPCYEDHTGALSVYFQEMNLEVGFTNPRFMDKYLEDKLSDEGLLRNVATRVSSDSSVIDELKEYLAKNKGVDFLTSDDKRVDEERYNRLQRLLRSEIYKNKPKQEITQLVSSLVKTTAQMHPEYFDELYHRIASDEETLSKIQEYGEIAQEIEQARKNLEELKQKVSVEAMRAKETEYRTLEKNIAQKTKEMGLIYDISALQDTLVKQKKELKGIEAQKEQEALAIERLRKEHENMAKELGSFEKSLENTVKKVAEVAFDEQITAKIVDAASRWKNRNNDELYRKRIEFYDRNIIHLDKRGKKLLEELLDRLQERRNYSRNEFINILLTISQNFLTIFSGAPGCGKTSICNIIGEVLGLAGINEQACQYDIWDEPTLADRYLSVSVERGWTSKRDFIGYYNPLNKTFEATDQRRYECFIQMDQEVRAGFNRLPYIILLDEANLSPMEYYFADFMNVCDARGSQAFISLGDKQTYSISDSLRFVATINNDHTTEILSPRLLDRSWIVTLPSVEGSLVREGKSRNSYPVVDFNEMKNIFCNAKSSNDELLSQELSAIYSKMSALGINVSPRSRKTIERYILAGTDLFERQDGITPLYIAIDYAVSQKLLPLVNGSGDDYQEELTHLREHFATKQLVHCQRIVDRILQQGNLTSGYYRFFME